MHREAFGSLLRRYREAAGLTQEELAERAGLTRNAISALERGERRRPYPHTVQALAAALVLSEEDRAYLLASAHKKLPFRQHLPPLPVPLTPLVGREQELRQLRQLIGNARIITLTGPGGVGKSRLGLELASGAAELFPDGVVFVPLASLAGPEHVVPTIADSLGVRESGGRSLLAVLRAHFDGKRILLLLDNFEHLLPAASPVAEMLVVCPDLILLVTSRAPLRVRGEREFSVQPLAVPDLAHLPAVQEIENVSGVQLFVQRAREVLPQFQVTEANSAAVASICRRLEGLPLALELAAAQLRLLSPMSLLAHLDRSLPILKGGARDLPERQRTMRGAIEWSYELLNRAERTLFRGLSVFAGGWTLEAAEATGGGDDVLGQLAQLIEHSVVIVETDGEDLRYRMLEPIRQYALEQLDVCQEGEQARSRHALYYLEYAKVAEPMLVGPDEADWLERLEAEHDNLRVALDWLLRSGDTVTAVRLGGALWRFWGARGHLTEGRRWLDGILGLGPAGPTSDPPFGVSAIAWANLLQVAGVLAKNQGDCQRSSELFEAGLALRRKENNRVGIAASLHQLGIIAYEQGRYESAMRMQEEALSISRELGSDYGIAYTLSTMGDVRRACGDYECALKLQEESLRLFQHIGHSWGTARSLTSLAGTQRAWGDHSRATALYKQALVIQAALGNKLGIASCLEGLADVVSEVGQPEQVVRLAAAAAALREDVGRLLSVATGAEYRAVIAQARAQLGDEAFEETWAQGRATDSDRAVEYGLSTVVPGSTTLRQDQ